MLDIALFCHSFLVFHLFFGYYTSLKAAEISIIFFFGCNCGNLGSLFFVLAAIISIFK